MGWAENVVEKYRAGKLLDRSERNVLRQALDEMDYLDSTKAEMNILLSLLNE